MAYFVSKETEWKFDATGARIKLVHSTSYKETITKSDIAWYALHMFPTSTIAISPQYFTYDEMKAKFIQMLELKNYENVTLIK